MLILASPINVVENGHLVSRRSDFIVYSVEAEYIDEVVKTYGPCKSHLELKMTYFSDQSRCSGGWSNIL